MIDVWSKKMPGNPGPSHDQNTDARDLGQVYPRYCSSSLMPLTAFLWQRQHQGLQVECGVQWQLRPSIRSRHA